MNKDNEPDQNSDPLQPSEPPNTASTPPEPSDQSVYTPPPAPPLTPPPAALQAPTYAAPQAPSYAASQAPAQQKTNILAILSLIFAFVFSIAGIILGHIALSQIKKTGESGRGLALAGTIIGYVFTIGGIIFAIVYFAFIAFLISSDSTIMNTY